MSAATFSSTAQTSETEADILAKNVALTSPFGEKLDFGVHLDDEWIGKCHPSLHRHSNEWQMGEISNVDEVSP